MNSREIADLSAKILDKKKGLDIVIMDIGEKSSFADYFVIASGSSERQVRALCDEIVENFEKEGIYAKSLEGKPPSGWVLMDYGDVIINIFTAETRERYNIEKIWGDCEIISVGV